MNWKHYGCTFLHGTGGFIHQRSQSVWSNLLGTSGALICRISVHVPPSASALTGCLFTWNYRTLQSIKIRKHFGAVFPAWSRCFLLIQSGLKCTVQIRVGTGERVFLKHLKYPGNRSGTRPARILRACNPGRTQFCSIMRVFVCQTLSADMWRHTAAYCVEQKSARMFVPLTGEGGHNSEGILSPALHASLVPSAEHF